MFGQLRGPTIDFIAQDEGRGLRQVDVVYGHRLLRQLRDQDAEAAGFEVRDAGGCAVAVLLHVQPLLRALARPVGPRGLHPPCAAPHHAACQGSLGSLGSQGSLGCIQFFSSCESRPGLSSQIELRGHIFWAEVRTLCLYSGWSQSPLLQKQRG